MVRTLNVRVHNIAYRRHRPEIFIFESTTTKTELCVSVYSLTRQLIFIQHQPTNRMVDIDFLFIYLHLLLDAEKVLANHNHVTT